MVFYFLLNYYCIFNIPIILFLQAQIPASKARNPASMVNGEDLGDEFYTGRSIMATKIPLRLHSALEHFTDLYERVRKH